MAEREALVPDEPGVLQALEAEELFGFFGDFYGEPPLPFDFKWLRAVGNERFTGLRRFSACATPTARWTSTATACRAGSAEIRKTTYLIRQERATVRCESAGSYDRGPIYETTTVSVTTRPTVGRAIHASPLGHRFRRADRRWGRRAR